MTSNLPVNLQKIDILAILGFIIHQYSLSFCLFRSSVSHSSVFLLSVYNPCTSFVRFIPNYFTFLLLQYCFSILKYFPKYVSLVKLLKQLCYYFEQNVCSRKKLLNFLREKAVIFLYLFQFQVLIVHCLNKYIIFSIFILYLPTLINSLISSHFSRFYRIFFTWMVLSSVNKGNLTSFKPEYNFFLFLERGESIQFFTSKNDATCRIICRCCLSVLKNFPSIPSLLKAFKKC